MKRKYYTVSEFAEAVGVSTQTVYQQLKKGRLRNYGRKVDGKQKIKAEALKLYRPEQEQRNPIDSDPEEQGAPESVEVRLLRELLAEREKRIEDLQQALMREHETLRQQQEIMREEIETIKGQITAQYLLQGEITPRDPEGIDPDPAPPAPTEEAPEEKEDPQQTPEEVPVQRKRQGFFARLFS